MRKRVSAASTGSRDGVVIGRERFAKISAVEGVELTAAMKKRAAEFDRRGLCADERRREIVRAHRKG